MTTTVVLCIALVLICVVPIAIMDDSRNPGRFVAPLGTPTLLAGIAGAIAMRNSSIDDVVMRGGEIADEYDKKLRQRAWEIISGASGIDRVRMRASVVSGIRVLFDRGMITKEQAVWMLGNLYA